MFGVEEESTCNRLGCTGTIKFQEPENCSCHISPPCISCVSAKLFCEECGIREDDAGWHEETTRYQSHLVPTTKRAVK